MDCPPLLHHCASPASCVLSGGRHLSPRCFLSSQEEAQKQKELAKAEIQKILKEKDQLTADLSSMEKSFSDLFKRFEKQKEVIEGYRTVGGAEWARACPPAEGPQGVVVSHGASLPRVLGLVRKITQVAPGHAFPSPPGPGLEDVTICPGT